MGTCSRCGKNPNELAWSLGADRLGGTIPQASEQEAVSFQDCPHGVTVSRDCGNGLPKQRLSVEWLPTSQALDRELWVTRVTERCKGATESRQGPGSAGMHCGLHPWGTLSPWALWSPQYLVDVSPQTQSWVLHIPRQSLTKCHPVA